MLQSRLALFTIPLICLLSAIFYFRDKLSQSFTTTTTTTTIEPSFNPSEPRILQVSMLFGEEDDEVYQRCLDTHFEHGKRWGYQTHVLRQEIRTQRYFLLNKPLSVLSYLLTEMSKTQDERVEWIVWFDADAVIMNINIPWSIFLPPSDSFSDIHIIGSNDGGGFNSGVILVRVCEWSVKVFTNSAALPEMRSDIEVRKDFVEQDAMQWVFRREDNNEHIVYAPQYWFNGYRGNTPPGVRDVQDGDMMSHFAGWGAAKAGMMTELFEKLERSPQELQVPLKDTYYPAEIDAFWSRLRDAKTAVQDAKAFVNTSSSTSAKEIEKAYLELELDIRLHTDQADLVKKGTDVVLAALNRAKEAGSDPIDSLDSSTHG